jgi:hypothetical protein
MSKKLTVLTMGLALQVGALGLANAGAPIDNFPMEDRAAEALKPLMAMAQAQGIKTEVKRCFLFNPPSFDRQWTAPCDPAAPMTPPMKMCRISNTIGWDAALFTEPCENAERRKGSSGG